MQYNPTLQQKQRPKMPKQWGEIRSAILNEPWTVPLMIIFSTQQSKQDFLYIRWMIDKASLTRQIQQISQLTDLPESVQAILIQNKKMGKKIVILEAEIAQKNNLIEQLKQQLDCTVIQQTQLKLSTIRNIQQQVAQQVNEIKHKYMQREVEMQGEIEGLRGVVAELQDSLKSNGEREGRYVGRIESFKEYISEALEEKDFLIGELGKIISEQERKIAECARCCKSASQVCQENKTKERGRKMPYIAKNE